MHAHKHEHTCSHTKDKERKEKDCPTVWTDHIPAPVAEDTPQTPEATPQLQPTAA